MKAQAFSISDSLLFELGLNGSGLGLMIFHTGIKTFAYS